MNSMDRIDTDIELSNLILRRGCGIEWSNYEVKLTNPKGQASFNSALYWIEVNFEFGRISIGQSSALFNNMLSEHLSVSELNEVSDNLKNGLIATVLDTWLLSLEHVSGTSASITYGGLSCAVAHRDTVKLDFSAWLPNGNEEQFVMCCDYSALPALNSVLNRLPSATINKRIQNYMPVSVTLRIGSSRLMMQDAWQLEVGDVLMIETVVSKDRNRIQAVIGAAHTVSAGFNSSGQLQIMNKTGENPMDILTEKQNELNVDDQVSVRLDFDIGQKEIPYAELSELTEGYVFDLGKQLSNGVVIRCGWRTVARGELIEIGESQLGVRIVDASQLEFVGDSTKKPAA